MDWQHQRNQLHQGTADASADLAYLLVYAWLALSMVCMPSGMAAALCLGYYCTACCTAHVIITLLDAEVCVRLYALVGLQWLSLGFASKSHQLLSTVGHTAIIVCGYCFKGGAISSQIPVGVVTQHQEGVSFPARMIFPIDRLSCMSLSLRPAVARQI